MGGDNTIYRPDPAKGEFNSTDIPVWDESFYNDYANQWVLRLAYDPKGEDLPTLGEQRECDSGTCEDLSADELKKLWQVYGSKFDGVFKRSNGSYYFFRNPINETPANPAICREGVNLKTSLTRTEADVLELWTSLSEHDLARCETSTTGEGSYKAILKDKTDYEKVKGDLNTLIQALEWEKANPGQAENPHNPRKLPLAIPPEKVVALRDQFTPKEQGSLDKVKEFFSDPVNLILTGVSLLIGGLLTGFGFAIAGRVVGHGTPEGSKETKETKKPKDPDGSGSGSSGGTTAAGTQTDGAASNQQAFSMEDVGAALLPASGPIPYEYATQIDGRWYSIDPKMVNDTTEIGRFLKQLSYGPSTGDSWVTASSENGFVIHDPAAAPVLAGAEDEVAAAGYDLETIQTVAYLNERTDDYSLDEAPAASFASAVGAYNVASGSPVAFFAVPSFTVTFAPVTVPFAPPVTVLAVP